MKSINFIICSMIQLVLEDFVFSNVFVIFTMHADLEGHTCPSLATRFDEYKLNTLQCVFLCAHSSSCFGVFHDQGNRRCVGCGDIFLTNMSAPTLNGMQYYKRRPVYKLITEQKTWDEAKVHCQGLGGHLADIKTEAEQMVIGSQVFDTNDFKVWIGASRKASVGPFFWLDDTSLNFTNWEWDQPNNDGNENCVQMYLNEPWKWHDYSCALLCSSLCEFD